MLGTPRRIVTHWQIDDKPLDAGEVAKVATFPWCDIELQPDIDIVTYSLLYRLDKREYPSKFNWRDRDWVDPMLQLTPLIPTVPEG